MPISCRAAALAYYSERRGLIRGLKHVPPVVEAVTALIEMLFGALTKETSDAMRAVLGHFVFVFINH